MGFMSWKTADNRETIWNVHTGAARDVYLLQPNGRPPIHEAAYDGYGLFGGIDVFFWLAHANGLAGPDAPEDIVDLMESLSLDQFDAIRSAGVLLDVGTVCIDPKAQVIHTVFHALSPQLESLLVSQTGMPVRHHPMTYADPINEFGGDTANDLIASGVLKMRSIRSVLGDSLPYPLKFSFDKDAVYEDLPASDTCQTQGYFGAPSQPTEK